MDNMLINVMVRYIDLLVINISNYNGHFGINSQTPCGSREQHVLCLFIFQFPILNFIEKDFFS